MINKGSNWISTCIALTAMAFRHEFHLYFYDDVPIWILGLPLNREKMKQ